MTPTPPAIQPSTQPTPWLAVALAVAFAVAVGLGQASHELWLDEIQAWNIAFFAGGLGDVVRNLQYEGHPPLWHALLHLAGRAWPSPAAMQLVAAGAAVATVFLFAWRSPFSTAQKVLFALGYFPLYEYGVIARSYGLGLALVAVFCALSWSGVRSRALLAVPLGLLAATSIYGVLVAWALAAVLVVEAWDTRAVQRPRQRLDAAAGALILGVLTLASLKVIIPPPDSSFPARWFFAPDDAHAVTALGAVIRAFLPVPDLASGLPWNTHVLPVASYLPALLAFVGSGVVLLAAGFALRASPAALAGWLVGTAALVAFVYAKYGGSMRHHGHLFILWLACLWIARPSAGPGAHLAEAAGARLRAAPPSLRQAAPFALVAGLAALIFIGPGFAGLGLVAALALVIIAAVWGSWSSGFVATGRWSDALRPGGVALTALLVVHALVGLRFWSWELGRTFGAGKAVADAIRAQPERGLPVLVADTRYVNYLGPVLAGYLGREVTYVSPLRQSQGSYMVWDQHRAPLWQLEENTRLALRRAAGALERGQAVLFATETPLRTIPAGVEARLVTLSFSEMLEDEYPAFALYRLAQDPRYGAHCLRY